MKYIWLLLSLLFVAGLAFFATRSATVQPQLPVSKSAPTRAAATKVQLIPALQFAQLAEKADSFVVDVHVPEQTHIPGTDAFIPYNQIKQNIDRLPQDKDTPILVYCRSGSMSSQAAQEIAALGYTQVYDLEGGTNAYKQQLPGIYLWPSKQDLGTVIYGDIASTEFTLTNYTSKSVNITRVSTSCSCTQAEAKVESLKPYQTTIIPVTFNPAVHKDDTDLGQLTRTIYIDTDDPEFPQLQASITANVVKQTN